MFYRSPGSIRTVLNLTAISFSAGAPQVICAPARWRGRTTTRPVHHRRIRRPPAPRLADITNPTSLHAGALSRAWQTRCLRRCGTIADAEKCPPSAGASVPLPARTGSRGWIPVPTISGGSIDHRSIMDRDCTIMVSSRRKQFLIRGKSSVWKVHGDNAICWRNIPPCWRRLHAGYFGRTAAPLSLFCGMAGDGFWCRNADPA